MKKFIRRLPLTYLSNNFFTEESKPEKFMHGIHLFYRIKTKNRQKN